MILHGCRVCRKRHVYIVKVADVTYCVQDLKNAKVNNSIDTELYKNRWREEACFAKLKKTGASQHDTSNPPSLS